MILPLGPNDGHIYAAKMAKLRYECFQDEKNNNVYRNKGLSIIKNFIDEEIGLRDALIDQNDITIFLSLLTKEEKQLLDNAIDNNKINKPDHYQCCVMYC